MATPEQVYNKWKSSLKSPDDSLFYYHSSLERILLGLAIYAISSKTLIQNLGKAKYLTLLNIYIPDLITAWIDENDEDFATMFNMTITVSESLYKVMPAVLQEHPSKKRQIRKLLYFFGSAIATGGDMTQEQADALLDDLTTDGKQIYSEKIEEFGNKLLHLHKLYGENIPYYDLNRLNGW